MSLSPQSRKPVGDDLDLSRITPWLERAHLGELGLTPRECEVMRWITEGKRDREIAIILGLSRRTVEKHATHIFEKLNVETRTAAVRSCQYSYLKKKSASPGREGRGRNGPKIGNNPTHHLPARGDPTQT